MPKRTLIFSLNYFPFVGGAEIAIKEITDRISPDEIEFHLIAYRFDMTLPKIERIGNVTVHRVGVGKRGMTIAQSFHPIAYLGKIFYVPFAALKALQLKRRHTIDAYWAMMSYMVFPIVLLRLVGSRTPYVLTLQEGDPFERVFERWYIRLFSPLLIYGFKKADTVQAISSFLLAWARRVGFVGKGIVIPNGVNTKRFSEAVPANTLTQIKESLGKKEGDIFLVTTSRLVHKNGIDTVIDALSHLPTNVHFLVYGDGPLLAPLTAKARMHNLEDRVHFLGQLAHGDLPRFLQACDVFIRPSRSEGMGNSFIEAMAAGLPVIATQEGGIADFLFDATRNPDKPTTGWAVDADSPEQIAAAVEDIMAHPERVETVAKTAKAMVVEKYDWNMVSKDMKALFDDLLQTR